MFATHAGGTQSARHIKPLHWYMACRLVLEGGFDPDDVTPRPPFRVSRRNVLSFDPKAAGTGEEIILGGLKTKNVDVVVTKPKIGPVLAISCKGATKAFRNLTNRMEETIGECTNLHITYPALVIGYFIVLRANRSVQDALEAPHLEPDEGFVMVPDEQNGDALAPSAMERIERNDVAILSSGEIRRFYSALSEMTGRQGIREEISRYEAIGMTLIEPRGARAGESFPGFPPAESPLHPDRFFSALYQQYDERFVFGAPLLAGRTRRREWASVSPIFETVSAQLSDLDYQLRTSAI
ncbi:MAG TPA: hypothetical protein VHW66_23290 [Stellaceae bacterium]|jgi:hypothetical protein|nr:hypothetical protein [Stellaceae bacterium]